MAAGPGWDGKEHPKDLFDVTGKTALVVGATGAFGQMASRSLGRAGAKLVLTGGNGEKLEALRRELRGSGAAVETVNRRPKTAEDAEAMVEAVKRAYGRLDILVVASGLNKVSAITEFEVADWDQVMEANVRGPWLMCRAAGRLFKEQGGGGKVILLSSTRGRLGHPAGYTAYCPSKAAVDLLAKTLSWEWGAQGITVNAIAPTVFRSDLTAWMYAEEGRGKAAREAMLSRIPLGRLAEPEDFTGALLFLSSRASNFTTGHVMYVDGGYTAG